MARKVGKSKFVEARLPKMAHIKQAKYFGHTLNPPEKIILGVGTLKSGNAEITNSEQKAEVLSEQFASVFT